MQVEEPIDIFVSHDWPLGITDYGNCEQLVCRKPFFEKEILEIESDPGPYEIQYNEEWLAITRKYNSIFPLTRKPVQFGDQHPDIQDHRQWVRNKLHATGARHFDFVQTVPPYDPSQPITPLLLGSFLKSANRIILAVFRTPISS